MTPAKKGEEQDSLSSHLLPGELEETPSSFILPQGGCTERQITWTNEKALPSSHTDFSNGITKGRGREEEGKAPSFSKGQRNTQCSYILGSVGDYELVTEKKTVANRKC